MSLSANRVIALCEQNAHLIREEINLIEAGELRILLRGEDITETESLRLRTRLGRLLEIIEGCGRHCT